MSVSTGTTLLQPDQKYTCAISNQVLCHQDIVETAIN